MSDKKTYVIISDTQCPYEDKRALRAVIDFIGQYQPDEVIHIGDVVDFPQPSRWTKGTREEFEGSVFKDAQYTVKNLIEPLRAVYSGPIGFFEGNHDLRPREYLSKYAPALSETEAFDMATLLEFEKYNITQLPDFYYFAPGWVATHGHRGNIRINTQGSSALAAARKMNKSVVMGHTHRLGVLSDCGGVDGNLHKNLTGFEVGNLMDMKKAQYLKGSTANWQQGFGIIHVSGNHVQPVSVRITNRKFVVDGQVYSV